MPRYIRYLEKGEYKYASVKEVGDMSLIKTNNKGSLVEAINELIDGGIATIVDGDLQVIRDDVIAVEGTVSNHETTIQQQALDIQSQSDLYQAMQLTQEEIDAKQAQIRTELDTAKTDLDQAKTDLINKADLTYVDGELVKKVDQNEYDLKYQDIEAELMDKVNLSQHQSDYDTLVTDINTKADSITVDSQVDSINQSIANQQTEIETAKTNIATLDTDITTLTNRTSTVEGDVTLVNQEVDDIQGELSTTVTKLTNVDGRLGSAETNIAQNANDITLKASQTELDTLSGTVSSHETTISQHSSAISLKAEATDVYTKVETDGKLGDKVDTTTYNNKMSAIDIDIDGISQTVSSQQTELNNLDGTVAGHTSQISTISQEADAIELRVAETEGDVTGLEGRVSTAETSISANTSAISLKADNTTVSDLDGRVSSAESELLVQAGEISQRVKQTDYDENVGLNKWVVSKYDVNLGGSTAIPKFAHIQGENPVEVIELMDSQTMSPFVDDYYIAHFFTNVYVETARTVTLSVTRDDSSGIYLNGAMIAEGSGYDTTQSVSLSLRAGWNTVDILFYEHTGSENINLGLKLSDNVDKLTAHIGIGDKNDTRLSQAETAIIQTSEAITLKADATEVTSLGNRVSTTEGSIEVLNDSITSKVEQTDFDAYSQKVDNQQSSITQLEDSITTKVEQTEYDLLNGRVDTAESNITQLNNSIELRVTKTEFDGLEIGGRNLLRLEDFNGNALSDYRDDKEVTYTASDKGTMNIAYGTKNHMYTAGDYIISFKKKVGTGDTGVSSVRLSQATDGASFSTISYVSRGVLSTEWREVSQKFTLTEDTYLGLQIYNHKFETDFDSSVGIKEIKIEKGSKATDWTPAPEDIEGDISNLDGRVSSAETSITANTNAISLKASQTDLDSATGRLSDAEAEIEVQAGQISQRVTKTEFDDLEIGGRNFLKNSDFMTLVTNAEFAPTQLEENFGTVDGLDLNSTFLGKTVVFSYFVHSLGEREADTSTSNGGRFGIHGVVRWSDSTGVNTSDAINYPFAESLNDSFDNKRVSMSYTFDPPNGYDTISHISFAYQPYAKPSSTNDETWRIGQPKLEIGTKSTDWSIAPEDTKNSLQGLDGRMTSAESQITQTSEEIQLRVTKEEFDNLQIGGKNHFLNSNFATGDLSNWQYNGDVNVVQVDGMDAVQLSGTSHGFYQYPTNQEQAIYTISFKAKSIGSSSQIKAGFLNQGSGKTKVFNISSSWNGYSFTTTEVLIPKQLFHFYATSNTAEGLYITDIKIEKGSKATDWTPAPEDVDSNIADLDSRITSANTAITQNSESINLKASKTDVYTKGETDTKLGSKADSSDVNALVTRVTNAESEIDQNSSQISLRVTKTEFDALEVGGRNILQGTKDLSKHEKRSNNTVETYDGFAVATGTSDGSSYIDIFADTTPVLDGLEYTVSFYAKSSNATGQIVCHFYSPNTTIESETSTGQTDTKSDGRAIVSITSEWKRYWVRWKQSEGGSAKRIIVGRNQSNQTASIAGVKLEKGSRATDWTPSVEDVDKKAMMLNSVKKVRYIRDWLYGSNVNTGNHWVEIKAFAGKTNVAKGKTVIEMDGNTSGISQVTDGDTNTSNYFSAGSGRRYVQVDLGSVYEDIDYLHIWHFYSDQRSYHNSKTEVSEDGSNWITLFDSDVTGEYKETSKGHVVQVNSSVLGSMQERVSSAESSIEVQSNQIALKVSQTEFETLEGNSLVSRGTLSDTKDWDTITSPGLYKVSVGNNTKPPNFPTNAYGWGLLTVEVIGSTVSQTYKPHAGDKPFYQRVKYSTSFTGWKESETTAGALSQVNNAVNPLKTRMSTAESSITQNSNNIALKVSETTYTQDKITSALDGDSANSATLPVGKSGSWIRIAKNSGSRAWARFIVRDTTSGQHGTIMFTAGTHYNRSDNVDFTLLSYSKYSTFPFTKARILTATTYDDQYLDLYFSASRDSSLDYWIKENIQSSGWEAVDFADATVPTGYNSQEFLISKESTVGGRLTSAESSITQNASNISLRVRKDNVISEINQSAESVDISASKINLNGAVTASHIKSLNGLNVNNQFIIDSSGNVTFKGALNGATGTFSGAITTNEDAHIGEMLYVGENVTEGYVGINFGQIGGSAQITTKNVSGESGGLTSWTSFDVLGTLSADNVRTSRILGDYPDYNIIAEPDGYMEVHTQASLPSGDPIFRVTSIGNSERLVVEHSGKISTSNKTFRLGAVDQGGTGGVDLTESGGTLLISSHTDVSGNMSANGTVSGNLLVATNGVSSSGDIDFNNNALIASGSSGSTNTDHIWHDDGANAWNFVSDGSYKQSGNSELRAGSINLNDHRLGNGYNLLAQREGGTAHGDPFLIQDARFYVNLNGSISSYTDVTFPVAFSNDPEWVLANAVEGSSNSYNIGIYDITRTGVRVYAKHIDDYAYSGSVLVNLVACGRRP